MKIKLADYHELITVNKLLEVTSARLFSSKLMFDSEGILSNEIFGISKSDRRGTFAYIKMNRRFFNPHIYSNIIKRSIGEYKYILPGERKYVVKNGMLVRDDANGWTGIQAWYDHWEEIDWMKRPSSNRKAMFILQNTPKDLLFIDVFFVIPPAYRDVVLSDKGANSSDKVNPLNTLYVKLIRAVGLIREGGLFARTQFATQAKIQEILLEIYTGLKSQISKKTGLIHKFLLGKTIDFGTRSVITGPTYFNNHMKGNIIDVEHSAVPASQCCSIFYPFIETWLKNFFIREIINNPGQLILVDESTNKEIRGVLVEPEVQFNDKKIRKMIENYVFNPDNRFEVVRVKAQDPNDKKGSVWAIMYWKGKVIAGGDETKLLDRPLTVADLIYITAVDTCEKRHVMISRYPVGTDKGIIFQKVRVRSTRSTISITINGKNYPFYPDIDLSTPHDKVGVAFIDSLTFTNSLIGGLGADYDGDQVGIRGIWSDEANAEVDKIMNSKISALNAVGRSIRGIAKELADSLFELTRDGKNGVPVPQNLADEYLSTAPDDFTLIKLTKMFASIANSAKENSTKINKARHNTFDTINVPANYFYKEHPALTMNIGRFVYNKIVLVGAGIIQHTGIFNDTLNNGAIEDLDEKVASLYLSDKIDRKQFNEFINRRETMAHWLSGLLTHTISERMLTPLPEIRKRKAELYKKYEKEIKNGNVVVMTNIEKELVDYAKEVLKDDPGMHLYTSGDLNFGNNYKCNDILKGPVYNEITGEFEFIGSSFADGLNPAEIPIYSNSILSSQYPASIGIKSTGYLGKKILATLQMMRTDEANTDCGSKRPIPIRLTGFNKKFMLYTNIVEDGKIVELTPEVIGKYVDKVVWMRSPMSCLNYEKNGKICDVCAGGMFRRMNVENVGLFGVQLSHTLLNKYLKSKHDASVKLYQINPSDMFVKI